jgi:hypothetical protein
MRSSSSTFAAVPKYLANFHKVLSSTLKDDDDMKNWLVRSFMFSVFVYITRTLFSCPLTTSSSLGSFHNSIEEFETRQEFQLEFHFFTSHVSLHAAICNSIENSQLNSSSSFLSCEQFLLEEFLLAIGNENGNVHPCLYSGCCILNLK